MGFCNRKWYYKPELWLKHELKGMRGWRADRIWVFKVEEHGGKLIDRYGWIYPEGYIFGKSYTHNEVRRLPHLHKDDICSSMFDLAMTHSLYGGFISKNEESKSFTIQLYVMQSKYSNISPAFIEELCKKMKAR